MSLKAINIIITLFLVSSISGWTQAQTTTEIQEMKKAVSSPESDPAYKFNKSATNELKMLASGLFLFYKEFLSSQDASSCSFTPSCSVYMRKAIKEQGPIFGVMNGFDRLSRCHNLCRDRYKKASSGLLIDPVKRDPYIH